ncbi:hypothetical protein [Rhodoferax lacus]|uniref:hypothetical protein n=1 Tax=Rhodoferax lacus TaxID=2184758 RepID=UPI0018F521AF|nr:hypothetical protein [Rhodoferax lacus]
MRDQLHALGRSPADQAPAGTFARDVLSRLLTALSWASSQLKGNTNSRLDTERLITFGQAAEGKGALETQMVLNHKQAIEYLVGDSQHAHLSTDTVLALHAFLSDGLMADPMACGRLRSRAVEIGGSVYLPVALAFIDVPQAAYVDAMIGVYELNRVELLRDVLAAMVRNGEAASAAAIGTRVPDTVAPDDRKHFIELVLEEFKALHPGNAVRFGIRTLELEAWRGKTR